MPLRRRLVLGLLVGHGGRRSCRGCGDVLRAARLDGRAASTRASCRPSRTSSAVTTTATATTARPSVNDAVQPWTSSGATVYLVDVDGTARAAGLRPAATRPPGLGEPTRPRSRSVPTGPTAEPVTISLDVAGHEPGGRRPGRVTTPAEPCDRYTLVAAIPMSRADRGRRAPAARRDRRHQHRPASSPASSPTWFVRRSLRPLAGGRRDRRARWPACRSSSGDVDIPARVHDPIPTTEVGQVGLAVNAMLDHVESSLQTRADTEERLRRFVSDAGHELRTPLAAVRGYAELMRRGAANDPEQSRHAAERIEAAGSRMGLLVEDLLLLASLDEERPLAHDVVDLHRLVDDAVAEAATAGPDHEWSVDASDVARRRSSATARACTRRSRTCSPTHAPTPRPAPTSSHRVWGDDTTGYVEVRDDGPGFPADLLPRVTDRFARGDSSRSRATGGSGLGLAIVKAVVEAHGGTVTVGNATPGPGAVVRVSVPIAPAPGAATVVAAAPPLSQAQSEAVRKVPPTVGLPTGPRRPLGCPHALRRHQHERARPRRPRLLSLSRLTPVPSGSGAPTRPTTPSRESPSCPARRTSASPRSPHPCRPDRPPGRARPRPRREPRAVGTARPVRPDRPVHHARVVRRRSTRRSSVRGSRVRPARSTPTSTVPVRCSCSRGRSRRRPG